MADLATLIDLAGFQKQIAETLSDEETGQVEWLLARVISELSTKVPLIEGRLAPLPATAPFAVKVTGTAFDIVANALDTMRTGLRVKSEQYPESNFEYYRSNPDLVALSKSQIADLSPRHAAPAAYVVGLGG